MAQDLAVRLMDISFSDRLPRAAGVTPCSHRNLISYLSAPPSLVCGFHSQGCLVTQGGCASSMHHDGNPGSRKGVPVNKYIGFSDVDNARKTK